MTAFCPHCGEILRGPNLSAVLIPEEATRLYNEFIALQSQLAEHLRRHHLEHLSTLHEMTNTLGLLLVTKCFDSSDPQFTDCRTRATEHARTLLNASFSMTSQANPPKLEDSELVRR